MSEVLTTYNYQDIVTSQRTADFVLGALGIEMDELVGQRVLDLGSGYLQQFAQEVEAAGGEVVSLDPNLPHSDTYVVKQLLNELRPDGVAVLYGELDYDSMMMLKTSIRKGIGNNPDALAYWANYYREMQGWPEDVYGTAVAGLAQALPFRDRSFDRIVATTSVPYGIGHTEIPHMLGECNRILRKGGTAHFWPVVSGGIEEFLDLKQIRELIKTARNKATSKVEQAALGGFGLEITESKDETWQTDMRKAEAILGEVAMRRKYLLLTRKTS